MRRRINETTGMERGFDSTSALLELLKKREKFETAYVVLENNNDKSKVELESRRRIKEILIDAGYPEWNDAVINFGSINPAKRLLIQPWVWISALALHNTKKYESIIFGYIGKSDYWHIQTFCVKSFEYSLKCIHGRDAHIPKFEYPREWVHKNENIKLISNFGKIGSKILKNIWTCENVEWVEKDGKTIYKPCKKCTPCTTAKWYDIKLHNITVDPVRGDCKKMEVDADVCIKEDIQCTTNKSKKRKKKKK